MKQFSGGKIFRRAMASAFVAVAILTVVCRVSAQTEQKLYDFCSQPGCTDGAFPNGGLVMDKKGNLFGTTASGGAHNEGTVFKISASGVESVLYSFCSQASCTDGANPFDGLIIDKAGNLYGTTNIGGAHGQGTVFKFNGAGMSVLYSFCAVSGCADGANPYAGVIMDKAGILYGTTLGGGSLNNGTVFQLSPASGSETVLHTFLNTPDFATPYGGVVMDAKGNLYGTTWFGGANGTGGVYEVGVDQSETRLYDKWCAFPCTQDGDSSTAALILNKGNLYGTSTLGGASAHGSVFQINIRKKKETMLHSFAGVDGADGAVPWAGLIRDKVGNFYGTTTAGGVGDCTGGLQGGCGTVFKLSAAGTETILHTFANDRTDGENPFGGLIMDKQNNLYGTTRLGGVNNGGTVYKITP